ncbi:MAG: 50S ribosomal protein L9 [Patescibacteria group bacterium]
MKVILLKDVANLGKAGEIKDVRTGYGLNFLLPEALAELATPSAIKQSEKVIKARAKEEEEVKASLVQAAAEIDKKEVVIKHKAKDGKLFGSVGKTEIKKALTEMNILVNDKTLQIAKPIKEIGSFVVSVDFGQGVKAEFTVTVQPE